MDPFDDRRETGPTPESVGRYYDEWTPRYVESFGDTFQACRPSETADLHRYILENAGIEDGDRVLDAGCGVCGPSVYFATHRKITIDAITVSQAQVSIARRRVTEAALDDRIAVHLADFNTVARYFPRDTFERVVFLESLSHASDPLDALRSTFEVLKPGGTVYIKDFFEKSYENADRQRRVRETIERVDRAFVLRTPRVEHTIDVLREVGFVRQFVGRVTFKNDLGVWAKFNAANDFDLYGGQEPIEWSDWLELRFQKPF